MKEKIRGIYKITCTKNKKFYIGMSENISSRFTQHKWDLKNNKKHGRFQNHFNKFGMEVFKFEIIEEMPLATRDEIEDREYELIGLEKPHYNKQIRKDQYSKSRSKYRYQDSQYMAERRARGRAKGLAFKAKRIAAKKAKELEKSQAK
jgi:group I intron endonuclease